MNNFKTTDLGGLPLKLNDFRYIHSGIVEIFKGVMSSYGITDSTAIILSGCEKVLDAGNTIILEGYVSIGGEVCYVPTHSYTDPVSGEFEYWMINVDYDSAGTKTFQNLSINETYEVRTGKVQKSTIVPAGFTVYDDALTLFEAIRPKLNIGEPITLTLEPNINVNQPFTAFKSIDGIVSFEGSIALNTTGVTGGAFQVTTLPIGYRPAYDMHTFYFKDGEHWDMYIGPTGNVYCTIVTASTIPANLEYLCHLLSSFRAV